MGNAVRVADRARRSAWFVRGSVLVLFACMLSGTADATLRISSHRFAKICRVVVTIDSPRGSRIVYDGPVRRGQRKTFRGGDGSTVCIQRNQVPERCNSPLTAPQCKVDRFWNRTILFNIQ